MTGDNQINITLGHRRGFQFLSPPTRKGNDSLTCSRRFVDTSLFLFSVTRQNAISAYFHAKYKNKEIKVKPARMF